LSAGAQALVLIWIDDVPVMLWGTCLLPEATLAVKPSVLLLSAYDAASHRYWRNWLTGTLGEYQWTVVALADRHFYWRVRSNALTYITHHREILDRHYDLIVATSMTDLATLRGLMPSLARVPTVVYCHENQFAYPLSENHRHKSNIINAQLNSVFTALAADKLLFNSDYNRHTFFAGAKALFKKMPDGVKANLLDQCESNAQTLAVPITVTPTRQTEKKSLPPEIVWNHRWEYDKQPEIFFHSMSRLSEQGHHFRLHVVGQSFRTVPACFDEAKVKLAKHIANWGFLPVDDYHQVLSQADIVVSTAAHDFQGLSMLEAICCGCVPVAPKRVAYPEYIPASLMYDPHNEVESLTALLHNLLQDGLPPVPDVTHYTGQALVERYKHVLQHALKLL
jgi:glycosyltransferase involved in cell wall biosynthesis